MKEVLLSRGLVAVIDDCDFELVSQFRWCARPRCSGDSKFYAHRRSGPNKWVFMHRFVMRIADSSYPEIDHKNGDGLDNRKENLRICTHIQNLANSGSRGGTSQFKGVSRHRKKWQVSIRADGKRFFLGVFDKEIEAALAYDREAILHHGEFALLNFPEKECAREDSTSTSNKTLSCHPSERTEVESQFDETQSVARSRVGGK